MPDEAIASRCFCDSGPRGGHDTFIDPGLASASMTIGALVDIVLASGDGRGNDRRKGDRGAKVSSGDHQRLFATHGALIKCAGSAPCFGTNFCVRPYWLSPP